MDNRMVPASNMRPFLVLRPPSARKGKLSAEKFRDGLRILCGADPLTDLERWALFAQLGDNTGEVDYRVSWFKDQLSDLSPTHPLETTLAETIAKGTSSSDESNGTYTFTKAGRLSDRYSPSA